MIKIQSSDAALEIIKMVQIYLYIQYQYNKNTSEHASLNSEQDSYANKNNRYKF